MPSSALAAQVPADGGAGAAPRLSTDYLNRFGEALMLIEMAPLDPGVVDDLRAWRAVGYVEHFAASRLRCADEANAAYAALAPWRRDAFEGLCEAMNRLIATMTALLGELGEDDDLAPVVEVGCASLRALMDRAVCFINANGEVEIGPVEDADLQGGIDALFR